MQACTMMTQEQFYLIRLHFSSPITSFFSFVDHSSGYNDTSRFRFICRYDTRTFRIAFYWDVKVYLQYNAAVWAFLVVGEWASKITKPEFWLGNHMAWVNNWLKESWTKLFLKPIFRLILSTRKFYWRFALQILLLVYLFLRLLFSI